MASPQRNPVENLTGWIAFEEFAEGDEAEWGWFDPLPDVKSLIEQLQAALDREAGTSDAMDWWRERANTLQEQLQALRNFNEATRRAYATLTSSEVSSYPSEDSGAGPGPSDSAGYIELDDRHNCPHGVRKGLGCGVCDPASARATPTGGAASGPDAVASPNARASNQEGIPHDA